MSLDLEKTSEQILEDLSDFLGISLDKVKKRAKGYGTNLLRDEWEKLGHKIYSESEVYLFDIWKHNTSQRFKGFSAPLMNIHDRKILDFGGGLGTLAMILSEKNKVYYYDVPGIISDFAKFRFNKHGSEVKVVENLDDYHNYFDIVLALEVMEHVQDLDLEISRISNAIQDYGSFYFKNSFCALDVYPCHYDYQPIWINTLKKYDLNPVSSNLSVKKGYTTKIRALRSVSKLGTGWHGIPDRNAEDPLVAVESRLVEEDYDLLINLYIELINEAGWKVIIATPTYGYNVSWSLLPALSGMVKPPHSWFNSDGPLVCNNRNQIVAQSLEVSAEWTHIWFVDGDTVPPSPYGLMRLLERQKPIISGLYARKTIPTQWLIWINDQPVKISSSEDPYDIYPEYQNKLIPITGGGAGCLIVSREVFENISPPWFKVEYTEGTVDCWGEDVYFFEKAINAGYQPYMDTSVMCLHYRGSMVYPISAQLAFGGDVSGV